MTRRPARHVNRTIAATAVATAVAAVALITPIRAQDGKAVYSRACASCHGDDAGGRLAPALVPFTRGSQDLLRIVRNGAGGMMTGFAAADVSDADVRAIESYLRSLPAPTGGSTGSTLPAPARAAVRGEPVTFGTSAVRASDRPTPARSADRIVEWPSVGADAANSRYSPLADINLANVSQLAVAWRWRPEERPLPEYNVVPGNFTSTPIMIDNVVYVSTNYNRVAAIDADTGAVKWVYDPRAYEGGLPLLAGGFRHRGVSAWRDSQNGNKLRILLASRYRLISLDAETGEPVASFGTNGVVDTSRDLSWAIDPSHFEINAAPTVYKDLVILGSAIGDNLLYRKTPPGDVRAYHARTGALVWRWSSIPQSPTDVGADTWVDGAWRDAGQIETWPGVTVDHARGLVYLPTGNPGNLYYGGARPGNNLFAETLIALDADTGKRKWHYQLVHHGLWDYSLPAQSMLMELTVDGRRIPAVTQLTKHGFVFAFDRVSGQPIWPIDERPVLQSDVPGEKTSPTQPFPTRPPPVSPQGVSLDDAFDLTAELKTAAQAEMQKYRIGPLFTPPSLQGSLIRPSSGGTGELGRRVVRSDDRHAVREDEQPARESPRAALRSEDQPQHARATRGPVLDRVRIGWRPQQLQRRVAAQQAALRRTRRHRHESGRRGVAGAIRLRRADAAKSSRTQGRDAARAIGDARNAWVHRHGRRFGIRGWWRPRALRLRQAHRTRGVARATAAPHERNANDLPVRKRTPVPPHHHRLGHRPGADGLRTAGAVARGGPTGRASPVRESRRRYQLTVSCGRISRPSMFVFTLCRLGP